MIITDIIQLLTLIIIVIGAIIAIKQLRDQHEWYRREHAISYSTVFHPELQKMRISLQENFSIITRDDPIPVEDIIKKTEEKKELLINLYSILNYYENIAVACFCNIADEEVLFDLIGASIIAYKKKLSYFIDYEREQRKMPDLFKNLTMLANRWEEIMNPPSTKPKLGKFKKR